MDVNNGRCLSDGRKRMQSPGKIENVKKKKIHAKARKVLYYGIGNFWVSGNGRGEVRGSRKKFIGKEGRAKGRVKLLRARGWETEKWDLR